MLLALLGPMAALDQPASPPPTAEPSGVAAPDDPFDASPRLARSLAGTALRLLTTPEPSLDAMQASLLIMEEAVGFAPDDPELWRLLLNIADHVENEPLRRRALDTLVRLEPDDTVLRLMRLSLALDRYQTVEERIAALERLLTPAGVEAAGRDLASRMALDLALIHRRRGDAEGFARELARAVELDPANRTAAAIAAGFFRLNVDDPYAEAELLVNLLIAAPDDLATMHALGQLLLNHGAYRGAARIYSAIVRFQLGRREKVSPNVAVDQIIAAWGQGDTTRALRIFEERRRVYDEEFQRWYARENPEVSPVEVAGLSGPLPVSLLLAAAVILDRTDDPRAPDALAAVVGNYEAITKSLVDNNITDQRQLAKFLLETAWAVVWLDGPPAEARRFLDTATQIEPLTDVARDRFDGWLLLREDEPARAAALLEPIASEDLAAGAGLALARLELGEKKVAARAFLDVYRRAPGSILGVWCADHLAEMIGRRPPLDDTAEALNKLALGLPGAMERYGDDPRLALSLRVTPRTRSFGPYEPVIVDIRLTNRSPFPLAIDPEGPIRPHALMFIAARTPRSLEDPAIREIVVDLGRRLRLGPGETLTAAVDLRLHGVADALREDPAGGAMVELRTITNFRINDQGAPIPGGLGLDADTPPFQVEGIRIDDAWTDDAITRVAAPSGADDLVAMALLGHLVARGPGPNASVTDLARIDRARQALQIGWGELSAPAQGWLLSVWPNSRELAPVLSLARRSTRRTVQLAYLMYKATGPDDPLIIAAEKGDDPTLKALVELVKPRLQDGGRPAGGG